jgi:hypothetical protein
MAEGLCTLLWFCILGWQALPCRGQAVNLDITSTRVSFGVWSFKDYIRDGSVDKILLAGVAQYCYLSESAVSPLVCLSTTGVVNFDSYSDSLPFKPGMLSFSA